MGLGLAPGYLVSDGSDAPSRSLRSSGLILVPRVRTETYGEAAFSVRGPRLWNSLPEELRSSQSGRTFKITFKTLLAQHFLHPFNL